MRKLFIFFLVLLCLFGSLSVTARAEEISGPYSYTIKGNGTATITSFDWLAWKKEKGDIFIPNVINGYSVTAIGDNAFDATDISFREAPISITIPEGVVSIGEWAFHNANVNTIHIPNSLVSIGGGAFAFKRQDTWKFVISPDHAYFASVDGNLYSKNDKKLVAGRTYPRSGDSSKLTVTIPEGITSIAKGAFCNAEVYELIIPSSVTEIGDYAFCSAVIRNLTIPSTVTSIGDYAFKGCKIDHYGGSISENVTYIGEGAFSHCYAMTGRRFVVPPSITEISDSVFAFGEFGWGHSALSGLSEIEWHDKVVRIGDYAFMNSSFSGSSTVQIPGNIQEIGKGAFYGSRMPKNLIIDEGVRIIGESAFADPSYDGKVGVFSLSLPSSITSIGSRAFKGTRLLKELTISADAMEIGDEAFSTCAQLEKVELLGGVVSIGDRAFSSCGSLREVTLCDSIRSIGEDAFDRTKVTFTVKKGSYAELWAQENGCEYKYDDADALDWLND